jgi:hypothetical protein
MDALCLTCGQSLPQRRKLKDFCSYSCRGQHAVKALDGPKYQSAFVGSKNLRKTKVLQSLKRHSRYLLRQDQLGHHPHRPTVETRSGLADGGGLAW